MTLRCATINDAGQLCRFARQAFYDSYAWYNNEQDMATYLANNFTTAQTEADISDPQMIFLLIEHNDELCGYAKLAWRNRPDITITTEK